MHPQPLASLEGSLQLSQALSCYPRSSTLLGAQLEAWLCFTPRIKDSRTCGVLGAEGSMCVCACARVRWLTWGDQGLAGALASRTAVL